MRYGMAVEVRENNCRCWGDRVESMPDGSMVAWTGELYPRHQRWSEEIYGLYRRKGTEFPAKLDGEFAIFLWDAVEHRPVIARDRVGVVPLLVWEEGGRLVLSDHVDGLMALGLEPEVNWEAVADFFSFFWTLGDKTFFRGVRRERERT